MARLKEIDSDWYEEAFEFCARHPYRTLPIAHWINEKLTASPFARPGWLLGEFDQNRHIIGLALISETGILFPALHTDECFQQIEAITKANPGMIRVLLGPKELVDILWARLQKQGLQARIDQFQTMYKVDKEHFTYKQSDFELRIAETKDLDQLVQASAEMAKEESGDDAQARNPSVFKERVSLRLSRKKDFIYQVEERLAFKASISSWIPAVGQIEGVYTPPQFRRQGIGRQGTGFVTQRILDKASAAILLVNRNNLAARVIYEELGYRPHLESRTIFISS